MVFLDGICHAAEIAGLAYSRLELVLTWLVLNTNDANHPNRQAYVAAFMDAWAFVDAIDRFRVLWKKLPGFPFSEEGKAKQEQFENLTQPVRDLRNVADHLAQRADLVASSGNPALGLLTWVTYLNDSSDQGFTCLLAPGTRTYAKWMAVNPAEGGHFSVPRRTGAIHLAAGKFRANLSAVVPEIKLRVHELERLIETSVKAAGLEGQQAGGGHFIALAFKANPGAQDDCNRSP